MPASLIKELVQQRNVERKVFAPLPQRVLECNVQQIIDVPVPQSLKKIFEVLGLVFADTSKQRTEEQVVHVLNPHIIQDPLVQVVKVSERVIEQVFGVPVPPILGEFVGVETGATGKGESTEHRAHCGCAFSPNHSRECVPGSFVNKSWTFLLR